MEKVTVRVAKTSRIAGVAGSIAWAVRNARPVVIQSVGIEATDRAVKAMTLAAKYLRLENREILFRPEFMNVSDGLINASTIRGFRFVVVEQCGNGYEHS